jgi:hypothetical protein
VRIERAKRRQGSGSGSGSGKPERGEESERQKSLSIERGNEREEKKIVPKSNVVHFANPSIHVLGTKTPPCRS